MEKRYLAFLPTSLVVYIYICICAAFYANEHVRGRFVKQRCTYVFIREPAHIRFIL